MKYCQTTEKLIGDREENFNRLYPLYRTLFAFFIQPCTFGMLYAFLLLHDETKLRKDSFD